MRLNRRDFILATGAAVLCPQASAAMPPDWRDIKNGSTIPREPANGPEASWLMQLRIPSDRVYVFYSYNSENLRVNEKSNSPRDARRVNTLGKYAYKYSDDHGRSWFAQRGASASGLRSKLPGNEPAPAAAGVGFTRIHTPASGSANSGIALIVRVFLRTRPDRASLRRSARFSKSYRNGPLRLAGSQSGRRERSRPWRG